MPTAAAKTAGQRATGARDSAAATHSRTHATSTTVQWRATRQEPPTQRATVVTASVPRQTCDIYERAALRTCQNSGLENDGILCQSDPGDEKTCERQQARARQEASSQRGELRTHQPLTRCHCQPHRAIVHDASQTTTTHAQTTRSASSRAGAAFSNRVTTKTGSAVPHKKWGATATGGGCCHRPAAGSGREDAQDKQRPLQ
jgi:hypothetical protein